MSGLVASGERIIEDEGMKKYKNNFIPYGDPEHG